MFELTNEQRRCFGLLPIESHWIRIEPKPSPYHHHATIAYLDGTTLRKYIETGESKYTEYEICEQLSDDFQYLLPKTSKGKPVFLSAANLEKRSGFGMCLSYFRHHHGLSSLIDLYSHSSQRCYFSSCYDPLPAFDIGEFQHWVEQWCRETSAEDLEDVARFAALPRQHIKFREGDVFRFKINRRLYGYGRILVDYALMRKRKIPFWDSLCGKPLVCSVYHIATERNDLSASELQGLRSLPSVHMMDNRLYYGDFEIIGNLPIREREDYPIRYGGSLRVGQQEIMLQCGKLFRKIENVTPISPHYTNSIIGFGLRFQLPILMQCIEEKSNAPYWAQPTMDARYDLRNPALRADLEKVCEQFGIPISDILL